MSSKPKRSSAKKRETADDSQTWFKCAGCSEIFFRKDLERRLNVCPKCGYHFRLTLEQRLMVLVDRGSFEEIDADVVGGDPLGFHDSKPYPERVAAARRKTGWGEAVITGFAEIDGRRIAVALFDFAFLGGSMGVAVGEKITRVAERALAERLPLLIVSASGGARMQEGVLSLMQMAKVSAALGRLRSAGVPYLSVLTDPTTGGVAASLAMLGDVNVAEPGALIGFAGPRVIEQTIGRTLPEGFQTSEFLLGHGMMDLVVERRLLKPTLARLLSWMSG
ncbi:MAG: acetyl-CoA carboxylase carboxyl transferase subunit beta [Candidatus Binatota bacterium]|jgi:acetyl-CoA carboxylase carboxyl transferase subunit beta|nr:acetyl-CoA carboxylase carboxyl transferase subunit beta [Candidatus Binatota bacterium]